jgi:hypothetical protein
MSTEEYSTQNLTPVAGVVIYPGSRGENPYVWRGQEDTVTVPSQYPRFMTPWNQVQLSNGWDRTDWGVRDTSPAASYLSQVAAFQPGQTRLYGSNPADFPMQGMAYPQWQAYVQSTAGAQPSYTGGVGTVNGPVFNPGSGA